MVKDNCNPVFDETFEYAINQEELEHKQLEVTICTQKQLFQSSSNTMGKVRYYILLGLTMTIF